MRKSIIRPIALFAALGVGVACGGGGSDLLFLRWLIGVTTNQEIIDAILGTDQIRLNYGGSDYTATVPHNSITAVGAPVAFIPQGTSVMQNAFLPPGAVPVIRVVDVNTGQGGITGIGLNQAGNDLTLATPLALPVGKWRLTFEGGYRFYSQTHANALDVGTVEYEFDVYGPNGFSNIPVSLDGNLPKNGQTQQGLSVTGRIPPNGGVGPASLKLESIGGINATYTTNKALGAETWTWNTNDTIAVPDAGLTAIRVKVQF